MNSQVKLIARSALSLVATLAIGGGVTYALFTSDPVTITGTTIASGSDVIRICNANTSTPAGTNTWKDSIAPVINFSAVNPGATGVDVSAGHNMYLGNDNGSLGSALGGGICDAYQAGVTPGNSTVNVRMTPTLLNLNCPTDPTLSTAMEIRFDLGGTLTPYKTLDAWVANTSWYGPTFNPGSANPVQILARLDSSFATQNATCTFDIQFVGQQV